MLCVALFALYLSFLPLFSSVDPVMAVDAAVIDYVDDDPSFSLEQLGKPPLDHQISPILLYTACIRVV